MSRVTRIEQLDDPRVEDYRELRERNLMQRECFIAESEVVLRVLVARGRFPIRSLLVAEPRLPRLMDVVEGLAAELPVYAAPQEVLNQIVGFRIHRGVLASAQRLPVPGADELLAELAGRGTAQAAVIEDAADQQDSALHSREGDLDSAADACSERAQLGERALRVVVLEGLTNHDNVGGVFRNAAAFGADAVLYDSRTCDPLYRKAIRVSVGGALFVPFAREGDSSALLSALDKHGFTSVALSPRADALPLHQVTATQLGKRVALWLGSEGPGLSAQVMNHAQLLARIDMAAGFDSLNVATTSGIALHALRTALGP